MPKHTTLPKASTDGVVITHHELGFWQCGMWVKSRRDATVYVNQNEAESVMALRRINSDAEIIPA